MLTTSADELQSKSKQFAIKSIKDVIFAKDGRKLYRIRWEDTWETENVLLENNCTQILKEFWAEKVRFSQDMLNEISHTDTVVQSSTKHSKQYKTKNQELQNTIKKKEEFVNKTNLPLNKKKDEESIDMSIIRNESNENSSKLNLNKKKNKIVTMPPLCKVNKENSISKTIIQNKDTAEIIEPILDTMKSTNELTQNNGKKEEVFIPPLFRQISNIVEVTQGKAETIINLLMRNKDTYPKENKQNKPGILRLIDISVIDACKSKDLCPSKGNITIDNLTRRNKEVLSPCERKMNNMTCNGLTKSLVVKNKRKSNAKLNLSKGYIEKSNHVLSMKKTCTTKEFKETQGNEITKISLTQKSNKPKDLELKIQQKSKINIDNATGIPFKRNKPIFNTNELKQNMENTESIEIPIISNNIEMSDEDNHGQNIWTIKSIQVPDTKNKQIYNTKALKFSKEKMESIQNLLKIRDLPIVVESSNKVVIPESSSKKKKKRATKSKADKEKRKKFIKKLVSYKNGTRIICEICSKTLADRTALKRHKISWHGEYSPHSCEVCSKMFLKPVQLKQHMLIHSDTVLYTCCNTPYKSKYSLKQHMLKKHKVDPSKDINLEQFYINPTASNNNLTIDHALIPSKNKNDNITVDQSSEIKFISYPANDEKRVVKDNEKPTVVSTFKNDNIPVSVAHSSEIKFISYPANDKKSVVKDNEKPTMRSTLRNDNITEAHSGYIKFWNYPANDENNVIEDGL